MKNINQKILSAVALFVASLTSAFAALPLAATDAMTAAQTDVGEVAGGILVVVIIAAAFKAMRRGA